MKPQYFSWIRNPMTIIALFVGLTEIGFGLAFSGVPESLRPSLLCVMIGFAALVAIGFFIVLWFRPHHFYSPRDYRSDEVYLGALMRPSETEKIQRKVKRQEFVKAEQPKADSIMWNKSGNLFWASHDLMLALIRIFQRERKDAIIYALQQSLHHIRELGFDDSHPIESKLNELLSKADEISPADWTDNDEVRDYYVSELEPLKDALGDLASEDQPGFDPGPKTYQLVIPLHR